MNHITIELCAEDRRRLDRVIRAMEMVTGVGTTDTAPEAPGIVEPVVDETAVVQEAPKTEPVEQKNPKPVKDVSLEQIQKKVVELCAAGKKEQARSIIREFGAKVSDLKTPELRTAAWDKLAALEVGA